jgi:hypothetical protein
LDESAAGLDLDAKDVLFKWLYEVKTGTFHKMLSISPEKFNALHKRHGLPCDPMDGRHGKSDKSPERRSKSLLLRNTREKMSRRPKAASVISRYILKKSSFSLPNSSSRRI